MEQTWVRHAPVPNLWLKQPPPPKKIINSYFFSHFTQSTFQFKLNHAYETTDSYFLLVEARLGCLSLMTDIFSSLKWWTQSKSHAQLLAAPQNATCINRQIFVTISRIVLLNIIHMHCSVLLNIIKQTHDKCTLPLMLIMNDSNKRVKCKHVWKGSNLSHVCLNLSLHIIISGVPLRYEFSLHTFWGDNIFPLSSSISQM
jgi:hypothetical protein